MQCAFCATQSCKRPVLLLKLTIALDSTDTTSMTFTILQNSFRVCVRVAGFILYLCYIPMDGRMVLHTLYSTVICCAAETIRAHITNKSKQVALIRDGQHNDTEQTKQRPTERHFYFYNKELLWLRLIC